MEGARVVECGFTFKLLNAKLFKDNPKAFEYHKVGAWLKLIQHECVYPYKWNKPTSKGLVAKCKPIQNEEEFKLRLDELEEHINQINHEYDMDIKLNRG